MKNRALWHLLYIDYKKKQRGKAFSKEIEYYCETYWNAFFEWFQNKMREIEDILLVFIVRMKYTIFSGIKQSKHKW